MYAIQNIKADNTHLVCVVDLLLFSSFSRLKLSADLLLWSKIQTSKIGGQLYSDTSSHKVSQLGAVYVVKSNQTKWRGAIDPTRSAVLSSILLSNVFLPKFFVKFFSLSEAWAEIYRQKRLLLLRAMQRETIMCILHKQHHDSG